MTFVFETASGDERDNLLQYINQHSFLQNWNARVLMMENIKGILQPEILVEIKSLKDIVGVANRNRWEFIITGANGPCIDRLYPVLKLYDDYIE